MGERRASTERGSRALTERGRENGKEERVFGLSGVGIKPKIKRRIK